MNEILAALPPDAIVLDLGSGPGSFDAAQFPFRTIRADLLAAPSRSGEFVVCAASRLPFAGRCFHAVILNHSLEHFDNLADAVAEISRVLAPGAALYIAVPDASTFTDRVYRWIGKGGGHVNLFSDAAAVRQMIAAATGLPHVGTRVLFTSLCFLNRRNIASTPPRKLALFCNGHEGFLRVLTFALRRLDRRFHSRTSVYGWAFYFGASPKPDGRAWSNVCVKCGSGCPSSLLRMEGRVTTRRFLPPVYVCPGCQTRNWFTEDSDFG